MENKKYFYGNEISNYGVEHNRVDYRALAECFDAVLCNDITKLFYSTINGEYIEPEQINGYIDNSEDIDELQNIIDELEELITEDSTIEQDEETQNKIDNLKEQIEELEREQEQSEIFQYFIIDYTGYRILNDHTNEIIFYIDSLDMYIWGVTHWGTSWDYVLTNIKINDMED